MPYIALEAALVILNVDGYRAEFTFEVVDDDEDGGVEAGGGGGGNGGSGGISLRENEVSDEVMFRGKFETKQKKKLAEFIYLCFQTK